MATITIYNGIEYFLQAGGHFLMDFFDDEDAAVARVGWLFVDESWWFSQQSVWIQ